MTVIERMLIIDEQAFGVECVFCMFCKGKCLFDTHVILLRETFAAFTLDT